MSLDDISVKIGIKDVGSLRDARDIMNQVHSLSGGVIAAMEAASRGVDSVGAKLANVNASSPQLMGVINVFAQAFQQVVTQWKGLDQMASNEVTAMRAEVTGMVEELKKATTELKGQFEALRNDPSLENISMRMSAIMEQSQRVASMQVAVEQMIATRAAGAAGGEAGAPDVVGAVTKAVGDAFGPALEDLGRRIDAYVQAAGGVASLTVGAVNNAVGEMKKVMGATQAVDAGIDTARIVMEVVGQLQGIMQAQQAVQAAPVSARRSREDKHMEDALGRVDLFFQSEWKLFTDRFGNTMDKVDEIFKNTNGLSERMEKLKDAVRDLMSSYRKGGAGSRKGVTGGGPDVEPGEVDSKDTKAGATSEAAKKPRGTHKDNKIRV
jgi:hypothetical protein